MEPELLGIMAVVAIAGAVLGTAFAQRVWREPKGRESLVATAADCPVGRTIWALPESGDGGLEAYLSSLSSGVQVLWLAAEDAGEPNFPVRRIKVPRPRVEEVLEASAALAVFGPVLVVVDGALALEAPFRNEHSTAAIEELLERATTAVAILIRGDDSLPRGPWPVGPIPTC